MTAQNQLPERGDGVGSRMTFTTSATLLTMKSLSLAGIFISSAGLVVFAVENYGYSPNFLIAMALLGVAIVMVGLLKTDGIF